MSGLDMAGFDLVIGLPEGPLADVLSRSPDLALPLDTVFNFVLVSGEQIRVHIIVQRPSYIGFPARGTSTRPLTLTCPLELLRLRSPTNEQVEIENINLRVIMVPALNAEGTQALLRADTAASGTGTLPGQPNLLSGMTAADFNTLLETEVLRRTLNQIGDVPLHLPVALSNPADGTQVERLGAGLTSGGIHAVLVGVRTGSTHAGPAGELSVPSFIEDPMQAGWVVRNGYLIEQMIGPGLQESFPTAEISYDASGEALEANTPPPIMEDGNLRITSLTVQADPGAGVIRLSGNFRDSGFGWQASGSFSSAIHISCEGSELRITTDAVESDADLDVEWWVTLLAISVFIVGIILAGALAVYLGPVIGVLAANIVGSVVASGALLGTVAIGVDTDEGTIEARVNTKVQPLQGIGPLAVPLPTVVEGLVLEDCVLDDTVFRGRFRYRDAAPVRVEGGTLLVPGTHLDLDTGAVFRVGKQFRAGVPALRYDLRIPGTGLSGTGFPGQPAVSDASVSVGDLRSYGGARIAITAQAFDDLTLIDLLDLSYQWMHLPPVVRAAEEFVPVTDATDGISTEPGTAPGEFDTGPATGVLVSVGPRPWQTFAVRTSDGRYAKCRARVEDQGVRVEYTTYEDATAPAVEIGGRASIAATRRRDVATVELAYTSDHWIEPVNLNWPLTVNWTLAGETLPQGATSIDMAGVSVDVEVSEQRLAFRTPLGTNVDEELGVSVTDATGRTVSTSRRVQLLGRRPNILPETGPMELAGSVSTGDVILTLAGTGRDALTLRLPAAMVSTVRQPARTGVRPAIEVLREALEAGV